MPYEIGYLDGVVDFDIPALPKAVRGTVKRAIEHRLTQDPVGLGKPLRHSFIGHRRLRVGDYRIVYRIIEVEKKVLIVMIKHRRDIYAFGLRDE